MAMIDMTRKRSQRMAYEAYVALYRRWMRAALGDPARAALAEATRRAEARWRALMVPASGPVPVSARAAAVDAHLPQPRLRSLAAWGG